MGATTDRFLLDVMLGKLATYLRMMGYDTAYALDRGIEADAAIRKLAVSENRRLITRDRELATRTEHALLVESRGIDGQLAELDAAGVSLTLGDPCRCAACNGRLDRLAAEGSTNDDVPDPADQPVWRCRQCGQPFWKGSHWDDVAARLKRIRDTSTESG
ncbi:MAG: Mut7-C RNAse domain-containing protein [Halobacteriales archaeon]